MRYRIYKISYDSINTDPHNMFGSQVYQVETKRLIELGFKGVKNDFLSEEEAHDFISNNENLKGWLLTILPYVTRI